MARIILLDSAPLGLVTSASGKPGVNQCKAWLRAMLAGGAEVLIPEMCDYEVRRELLRVGSTAGLKRLDDLEGLLDFLPLTSPAIRRAAELWAFVRQSGMPTAHREALDADALLAGQAANAGQPGDTVTIATTNLHHLGRFPGIDAAIWTGIT